MATGNPASGQGESMDPNVNPYIQGGSGTAANENAQTADAVFGAPGINQNTGAWSMQTGPNYPAQGGYPQAVYPNAGSYPQFAAATADNRGFWASLFDFSFSSFVTLKFAATLYLLSVVFIGLVALGFLMAAFDEDSSLGVLALLFGWIPLLMVLVVIRVGLESIVAVVRIAQNSSAIRESLTGK